MASLRSPVSAIHACVQLHTGDVSFFSFWQTLSYLWRDFFLSGATLFCLARLFFAGATSFYRRDFFFTGATFFCWRDFFFAVTF